MSTINIRHRDQWRDALTQRRPVLVHLNADTTWLIQLPSPSTAPLPNGRSHLNILIDPWLQGPQADVASWFSKQWHIVPSSVQTLAELNTILGELEPSSAQNDASRIDVVLISHEFTDHCHEATLRELPPSTPLFATDKAAALIRTWRHFDTVTTTPGFTGTDDWHSLSTASLPPWLGIGRVVTPGNALYYHSALIIALNLHHESETSGAGAECILYSPHGIQPSDLSPVRASGLQTLALLHGLHDVGIRGTKQLNLGALNGIRAVGACGARYWVATHDEVKKGGGLIAPLLRRTRYTLKQAVEAEGGGEVKGYRFEELGSGDLLVLV